MISNTMRDKLITIAILIIIAVGATVAIWFRRQPVGGESTFTQPASEAATTAPGLPLRYEVAGVLAGPDVFREYLAGVAVTGKDWVVVAGDRQVLPYDHCATPKPGFTVAKAATAVAVDAADRVYVGQKGQVQVLLALPVEF